MKFEEARQLLEDGKMVVRECWEDCEGYLQAVYGMEYYWKILPQNKPHPNAGNYTFSRKEYEADDWVQYPIEKVKAPAENIEL